MQSMYSGMFAGFVNSFFLSPIELVKCRLQIQSESKVDAYYKGSLDCVRKIIVEEGFSKGLFKGTVSTIFREVPCYATQFGTYFLAKQFLANMKNVSKEDLSMFDQFVCGGFSGFWCWVMSYP